MKSDHYKYSIEQILLIQAYTITKGRISAPALPHVMPFFLL